MSARVKPSEVTWATLSFRPRTYCVPPSGVACGLEGPTTAMSAADARRHAADHPGHQVVRETTSETRYYAAAPEVTP